MTLSTGLIAHWPFQGDLQAHGIEGLEVTNHNVTLAPQQGALFNGRDSFLEIANHPSLRLGKGEFSVSMWVDTDTLTDVVGDLISQYDAVARRGWSLNIVTNTGVTSTAQPNYRHLHFGIDNGVQDENWHDCGQPGNAISIYALATVNGHLYAGTFEKGANETGHLWRYSGEGRWHHCGATPDGSNTIPSIVDFDGALYCSTGRYNSKGSSMGPPLNTAPGGQVYRVEADGTWVDCGRPGSEDAVPEETVVDGFETGKADKTMALTVFKGRLYATSCYRRGAFVYEGGTKWKNIGPNERLMTFSVYRDELYALVNGGPVLRYEGDDNWVSCGCPGASEQTYASATYQGELLVGTWPDCQVVRYGDGEWEEYGRVGLEMEVMAMSLYNAKVYLGTLPMANAWRLDEGKYTYLGNLDNTPEAYVRRVWSMSVYDGKLYAGTLPAGRVLSYEAGRMATYDKAFPPGRHHIAAVRTKDCLNLYVDGELVAQSSALNAADFDLDNGQALKIGFGPHQYFQGSMSDLRLYNRALDAVEIGELAQIS